MLKTIAATIIFIKLINLYQIDHQMFFSLFVSENDSERRSDEKKRDVIVQQEDFIAAVKMCKYSINLK